MTPEEIELLSQLTIVIPTFNRPLELERSIEYWRDTPVTVHILDGSDLAVFEPGKLPGLPNFNYHHIPRRRKEDSLINVTRRLVFASNLPATKYSAVCCDDDFYTKSGLVESLRVLNSQSDIDAVVGRVLTYSLDLEKIEWWCKYLSWGDSEELRSNQLGVRAESPGNWFLYGVCRTKLWTSYIRCSYEEKSYTKDNVFANEWLMNVFSRTLFRVKFLERISTVRQTTQVGANKPPDINWHDWLSLPQFKSQVDDLVDQLVSGFRAVSQDEGENRAIARKILYRELVRLQSNKNNIDPLGLSKRRIIQILGRVTPNWMKNIIVMRMSAKEAVGVKRFQLKLMMKLLRRWGVEFSDMELQSIERLLVKPREELRLRANI